MIKKIRADKPLGATHWQAGYYYKESSYGVWFQWNGEYWTSSFKFPDILCMTKL